jgi:hypothetical protein
MNYYYLGKLPFSVVAHFENLLRPLANEQDPFQSINFNNLIRLEFRKIFSNSILTRQLKPSQKAFFTRPGYTAKIHKDGTDTNAALNIAISCNPTDWVRWHSQEQINSLNIPPEQSENSGGAFRRINLLPLDNIDYIEQQSVSIGDVYLVNTNVWHSFKCSGDRDRIIIQTKFASNPTIDQLVPMLTESSFYNIIHP